MAFYQERLPHGLEKLKYHYWAGRIRDDVTGPGGVILHLRVVCTGVLEELLELVRVWSIMQL